MTKIFDLHNDFLTNKNLKNKKKYIKQLVDNKSIEKICAVIWTSKMKNPLKSIVALYNKYLKNNNKLVLCIEDLSFINKNNYKIAVETLIKLKPLYCGIVWNYDNTLGGGAFGKRGLTQFGKKVIQILEENNILIDTAHMNRKTFYDFCKITKRPILCSHTNINNTFNHKRNLTNKQILTIIESGGLIGISFVKNFVSNFDILSIDIRHQFDFLLSHFSCQGNLAIGSDFYGTDSLPLDVKNYNDISSIFCQSNYYFLSSIKNDISYKNAMKFFKTI